jgi:hypothetical protein
MKTLNIPTEKRTYLPPVIESIRLDNEISLALESAPTPDDTDEVYNTPEYFNNDPYKGNMA